MTISHERMKKLFRYDPETGELLRRSGTVNRAGYVAIRIDGKLYLAHRLAWFYTTGKWPKSLIDHCNGKKTDNRITNLREATPSMNAHNIHRARSTSKSGCVGASLNGDGFQVVIKVGNKRMRFGTYPTAKEASAVYLREKRRLGLLADAPST